MNIEKLRSRIGTFLQEQGSETQSQETSASTFGMFPGSQKHRSEGLTRNGIFGPRHQHMSKYGSYDPYIAQHMSKYGSYDPNIAQHRKNYRKFENPKFYEKFQMFKMTQKSFSAYQKIPKSDFSNFVSKITEINN